MNELSDNNTYGSFIDLPDRSWCEFTKEYNTTTKYHLCFLYCINWENVYHIF